MEREALIAMPLVTLDIDWAPDWMVADAANQLVEAGVKATWFVTHASPVLDDLLTEDLFEIGWHPNFLPMSSHGENVNEVLSYMHSLVPGVRSVRTHSLAQAEPTLHSMCRDFGIANDCSIHLPQVEDIAPHALPYEEGGIHLRRLPHFFQDNMHMAAGRTWNFDDRWFQRGGLKVYCFHPIHIALNSEVMAQYAAIKNKGPLPLLSRDDLGIPDLKRPGAGQLFLDVVGSIKGRTSMTVDEWATDWFESS